MNSSSRSGTDRLRAVARRALLERGMLVEFSEAAMRELEQITRQAPERDSSLRDLRSLLWCSIDNDESRDLDQLSVALPGTNGGVTILVAVADVDALVQIGGAIDQHAQSNTTSVYTAAGVFPMLPEQLSTDLTSLGQGQDRLPIVTRLSGRGG